LTNQELLERLLKMEDRLDQVTKQDEQFSREVREFRSANGGRNAEVDAPVDAMQPNTNETRNMPAAAPSGGWPEKLKPLRRFANRGHPFCSDLCSQ
jgi:hypothetical protein